MTINFKGVELILPPEVPFTYTPKGTLALDFSAGFSGKLHLRAGERLCPSPQMQSHRTRSTCELNVRNLQLIN